MAKKKTKQINEKQKTKKKLKQNKNLKSYEKKIMQQLIFFLKK